MKKIEERNLALLSFVQLPLLFLTAALLGGLRVSAEEHAFVFVPPPLVTLILAALLMLLFRRGSARRFARHARRGSLRARHRLHLFLRPRHLRRRAPAHRARACRRRTQ